MRIVSIPFNQWSKRRIAEGKKTATSRSSKYGEPGDRFWCNGVLWKLTDVIEIPLQEVIDKHFRVEGAVTRKELINVWNEIHPKHTYERNPNRPVWFHRFEQVHKRE